MLNEQKTTLAMVETRFQHAQADSSRSHTLHEHTYQHFFPSRCLLGKVEVARVVPSPLSWYHTLNPEPSVWHTILELKNPFALPSNKRVHIHNANVGKFSLRKNNGHAECSILQDFLVDMSSDLQ